MLKLFPVRCYSHVLSLLVQDGLSQIKDVIGKVRESVKYINYNDARLKAFSDVVEQKGLKDRKFILDFPTRWNSTYHMLFTALIFRIAFPSYKEREPHLQLKIGTMLRKFVNFLKCLILPLLLYQVERTLLLIYILRNFEGCIK